MRFSIFRDIANDKKIWFSHPRKLKVKKLINGVPVVIMVNASHAKMGILRYLPASPETKLGIEGMGQGTNAWSISRWANGWKYQQDYDSLRLDVPLNPADYPFYIYVGEDETKTDEPATDTIVFPPPETHEEFMERVWSRLLHLSRRSQVLRHEDPHMNALSEDICREVPANHEEVLRYTISGNLIKRPIGWLALQLQTQQNRYNRYLEQKIKAETAGNTPPIFAYDGERVKIEGMLEKLEENLTEDCLREHYDMHDHGEWEKIQIKQRKITLCNADFSPGEVLVNVNDFFTDGRGNIAEEHAKRTYHEISTRYWVMAKRTPHRRLVTEKTVDIS